MMNKIEQLADTLKTETRQLADRAISSMRSAGLETASFLAAAKGPVHSIADTGLKLNNLSHKSIERLLKQQVAALDDLIDGSTHRIEKASRAQTVRTMVDFQISTLPKSRDKAVTNARKTVAIVRDTGEAFGDLVKDVVVDISSANKGRKPAAKKAAGRPAKKKAATRKPAAKKASAKKTTARKTTAKKRATKSAASGGQTGSSAQAA
ncbi:phasin family protein [Wenzhouxiangella sp. XN24]|uniref:phasin family protein n=1 Tax=Wenzhouxiangella sp. XN24 TaxID=2713569 RepID=UPI0013EDF4A9|nr:phasin family protein [Wenzhouxiangella sp. XN24]NGX16825.1 hypothetical protein [Wenzhouxiangella sp. XN24]